MSVGGGTAVGFGISLVVGLLDADTFARIEGSALINQSNSATADEDQSVVVSATDAVDVTTIGGGGGGGIVGAGASVDVLMLRNDTLALIGGGARVRATAAVRVNALSHRDLDSKLFSGGAGGLGLGGSVAVHSIGGNFTSSYTDPSSPSNHPTSWRVRTATS